MAIDLTDLQDFKPEPKRAIGKIYFLFLKGIVVYVGQTLNINSRIAAHSRSIAHDEIKVIDVPREDLDYEELEAIKKYVPIFNKAGKPKDAPKVCFGNGVFLFCDHPGYKYTYSDGKIFMDTDNVRGRYNDSRVVIIDTDMSFLEYDRATNKLQRKFITYGCNAEFDEVDFTYKSVAKPKEPFKPFKNYRTDEVPVTEESYWSDLNNMPDDLVFMFGKYNGQKVNVVKLIDANYVHWVLKQIPKADWKKRMKPYSSVVKANEISMLKKFVKQKK